MSDKPLVSPEMTADEARGLVEQINANLHSARGLLLELYNREGWRSLGYASWRACVTSEFVGHQSTLYRELEAAQVELNIFASCENGQLPAAHARILKDLPPEMQRIIYEMAGELGEVTTAKLAELLSNLNPEQLATVINQQDESALSNTTHGQPRITNWPRTLTAMERKLLRLQVENPGLANDVRAVVVAVATLLEHMRTA